MHVEITLQSSMALGGDTKNATQNGWHLTTKLKFYSGLFTSSIKKHLGASPIAEEHR